MGRVWAEVAKVLSDPNRLLEAASSYLTAIPEAAVDRAAELVQVQQQIETLERRTTETAAEYLRAGLPAAVLASALAEVQADLQALTERRDQLQAVEEMAIQEADRAVQLQRLAREAAQRLPGMSLEQQREVLRLLRVRVTVLDGSADPALMIVGELPGGGGLLGTEIPGDDPDPDLWDGGRPPTRAELAAREPKNGAPRCPAGPG